ncbi:MAG: alkaline phosphatase family protein [Euryarchaeota archaeon]|nr:alkaline phosphatase family protein [Euryarchaeota archaeon]
MKKVVVIGLDGATLDLLEPWMDAGSLPNLDALRKKGAYGRLRSTIPYYSAPAWVSIVTGCGPGKHGIYDFFRTDTCSKKLISGLDRKVPAIWNLLTDDAKKSIVVNVPGTYPPEEINGVMVTGLLTPSLESEYTYPNDLKKDLVEGKLGRYEIEQVAVDDIPKHLAARYAPEKLVQMINNVTTSHAVVTMNLMKTREWDFTMVVFRGTDDAQHLLWTQKELLLSCYKTADRYIGEIMMMYPDASIVVVSDHGFYQPKKYLYVNNVLCNEGYLKTRTDPRRSLDTFLMVFFDKVSKLLFHLVPMQKIVRSPLGRKLILSGGGNRNIDFSQTKAMYHSVCSRGIRIFLKDKVEKGIVEKQEYDHLRQELIALFSNLTDPETGGSVVDHVYRWEELYGDDAVNDPLDLILDLKKGYGTQEFFGSPGQFQDLFQSKNTPLPTLMTPGFYDWAGDHAPDGVVFVYGADFKQNQRISASVIDILPTVLALLGSEIPDYVDGCVISEAFITPPAVKKVNEKLTQSKKPFLSEKELKKIRDLRLKL